MPDALPPQTAPSPALDDRFPLLFARCLARADVPAYLMWQLGGRTRTIDVRMGTRSVPGPHRPRFQLRPPSVGNNDVGVAYEVFVHRYLVPPFAIEPGAVRDIVDLGANVGLSSIWWLTVYPHAHVTAFEPHPVHAAQAHRNVGLNGFTSRFTLHEAGAGPRDASAWISDQGTASTLSNRRDGFEAKIMDLFTWLSGRHHDILKIDIEGSETGLLADPRFDSLDVGALVMEWHGVDDAGEGGRDWCVQRLEAFGYRIEITVDKGPFGMLWARRS